MHHAIFTPPEDVSTSRSREQQQQPVRTGQIPAIGELPRAHRGKIRLRLVIHVQEAQTNSLVCQALTSPRTCRYSFHLLSFISAAEVSCGKVFPLQVTRNILYWTNRNTFNIFSFLPRGMVISYNMHESNSHPVSLFDFLSTKSKEDSF